MNTCAHCGNVPDRREDSVEDLDLVLFICPVCNHHGGVSTSEAHAAAKWDKANDPALPRCCGGQGAPRFFLRDKRWGTRCSVCAREDHGFMSVEGAVAGWRRSLR